MRLGIWKWVCGYMFVIVAFAGIYYKMPDSSWNCDGRLDSYMDCIYFSVETITSLGFGDIFPDKSAIAKLLVSVESISGILVIGFFLNDVARKQALKIDDQNRKNEEKKKADMALANLKIYFQILKPVVERYLSGVYMMVTPMKDKFKMPADIIHHEFTFEYKDIGNIYEQTILMSSDLYVPSVTAHFKNQEIIFNEFRHFVTNADLSYWPDIRQLVYDFITQHHLFQMQDVIINNGIRKQVDGTLMKDYLVKHIGMADKTPKFESGNMFSPYVALYHFTKSNVSIVQSIYGKMENAMA